MLCNAAWVILFTYLHPFIFILLIPDAATATGMNIEIAVDERHYPSCHLPEKIHNRFHNKYIFII